MPIHPTLGEYQDLVPADPGKEKKQFTLPPYASWPTPETWDLLLFPDGTSGLRWVAGSGDDRQAGCVRFAPSQLGMLWRHLNQLHDRMPEAFQE